MIVFDRWLIEAGQRLVELKLVDQRLGLLPIENRDSYARLPNSIVAFCICNFQTRIYYCVSIHRFHKLKITRIITYKLNVPVSMNFGTNLAPKRVGKCYDTHEVFHIRHRVV